MCPFCFPSLFFVRACVCCVCVFLRCYCYPVYGVEATVFEVLIMTVLGHSILLGPLAGVLIVDLTVSLV